MTKTGMKVQNPTGGETDNALQLCRHPMSLAHRDMQEICLEECDQTDGHWFSRTQRLADIKNAMLEIFVQDKGQTYCAFIANDFLRIMDLCRNGWSSTECQSERKPYEYAPQELD